MAVRHGYGKVVTDGLVFAYDTGDIINSFKGKPGTNILKFINQQYSDANETYFKLTNGIHDVYIPTLGTRTVKYVDIWNDYNNGSGRCCLSLFSYGTGITAVQPSTTYMYQVVYKTDTGYSHANYMYRYEYGASGYIKEGGLHSTSRRTALGDGWYHGWGSFTTDANTTYINTYLFHYEYATQNRVQVAAVSLTEGTEIIPPKQFIGFEQTRSATEGLLDLTGNNSVDLANVSFDTNAQITFDGSSNYVDLGTDVVISPDNQGWTAEYWFNTNSASTLQHFNSAENDEFNANWLAIYNSKLAVWNRSPGYWKYGDTIIQSNTWYQAVFVCDPGGTNYRYYINGIREGGDHVGNVWNATYSSLECRYIGRYEYNGGYSRYFNGELPLTRMYNRALTDAEILQNFNHSKTRFGI